MPYKTNDLEDIESGQELGNVASFQYSPPANQRKLRKLMVAVPLDYNLEIKVDENGREGTIEVPRSALDISTDILSRDTEITKLVARKSRKVPLDPDKHPSSVLAEPYVVLKATSEGTEMHYQTKKGEAPLFAKRTGEKLERIVGSET